jgi:hypothetical protein
MSVYAALRGPFFARSDDALIAFAFRHTQRHLHPLRKRDEAKLTELTRQASGTKLLRQQLHDVPLSLRSGGGDGGFKLVIGQLRPGKLQGRCSNGCMLHSSSPRNPEKTPHLGSP